PDGFLDDIRKKRFADIDEWQTQMQLKATRVGRVSLYSGALGPADQALTGVASAASVEAAVMEGVRASDDRSVAVIPEGPDVVPGPVAKPPKPGRAAPVVIPAESAAPGSASGRGADSADRCLRGRRRGHAPRAGCRRGCTRSWPRRTRGDRGS